MKALFITSSISMDGLGGGVQRCTLEYKQTLEGAGLEVTELRYGSDMRPATRVRRKLMRKPYVDVIEPLLGARVCQAIKDHTPDWIFFNECNALPILSEISATVRASGVRLGLLSHGLDSTDYLHYQAPVRDLELDSKTTARQAWTLGHKLFAERGYLQEMDLTCCLAPTDVEIHRWLGSQKIVLLPRVVEPTPIAWQPLVGRLGTISTLVHKPNYQGLEDFCHALVKLGVPPTLRLRIVGRPEDLGRTLQAQFPFIDYLGGLSDEAMAEEARSWAAFVNPIFGYPRGCSTKLAVPLSWQIPVMTSRAGARGYVWDESLIPLADTAVELAATAISCTDLSEMAALRNHTKKLAARSPSWAEVSGMLRSALVL
jgi:hypothetical protein